MVRPQRLALVLALLCAGAVKPAAAAEATDVATAIEEGNPIDVFFSVGWRYEHKSAKIKRELEQAGQREIGVVRDLKYQQMRNILDLRLEIGVLWDVSIFIAAPLVLADSRSLSFDQDAQPCSFTGTNPSCVDQNNSTLLNDKGSPSLLPRNAMGFGLDGTGSAPALYTGGTKVFEGPVRAGLESLNFGFNWAILNQRKDPTKPTWTVGTEARMQVTDTQSFDRGKPDANKSVGLGYHVLRFQTTLSKRLRRLDPYLGFAYELPIIHNQEAFPDFTRPGTAIGVQTAGAGTGQGNVSPQHRATTTLGTEIIAYENDKKRHRVAIDLGGRLTANLQGRGWSEIWEILTCRQSDPAPFQSSLCPVDPNALYLLPGTSEIENYFTFTTDIGVRAELAGWVRLRAAFGIDYDQTHLITMTNAGRDRPPHNGQVDPGSPEEVNPLHRQQIDLVGRRLVVEGATRYRFGLMAMLLF